MPEVEKLLESIKGLNGEDKVKLGLEMVKTLTMVEISQWVKLMETEFGVSAAAPVAVAAVAAPSADAAAPVEEPTEFNVVLVNSGDKKIQVIKEIRTITNLGLKEAKDLVDNPPKVVKENLPKKEAEEIKKKLEEAGAVVELKS